jgi:hypothetical protein
MNSGASEEAANRGQCDEGGCTQEIPRGGQSGTTVAARSRRGVDQPPTRGPDQITGRWRHDHDIIFVGTQWPVCVFEERVPVAAVAGY